MTSWTSAASGISSVNAAIVGPAPCGIDLLPHQRTAVAWMHDLHNSEHPCGGILADPMGLGKTRSCGAFMASLLLGEPATANTATTSAARTTRASTRTLQRRSVVRILLVAPKGIIHRVWVRELADHCGLRVGEHVHLFMSDTNITVRQQAVNSVQASGGVVVTNYEQLRGHRERFGCSPESTGNEAWYEATGVRWDVVILDEVQAAKNRTTQTYKAINALPKRTCIGVTGTPQQNNVDEQHALMTLCNPRLAFELGSAREFEDYFSAHINLLHLRNTPEEGKSYGEEVAAEVREICAPFLLRREQASIKQMPLKEKTELVVWLELSSLQKELYSAFANGQEELCGAFNPTGAFLSRLTAFSKICNHPALLAGKSSEAMKLAIQEAPQWAAAGSARRYVSAGRLADVDLKGLTEKDVEAVLCELLRHGQLEASCKVHFTLELLQKLKEDKEGKHKTLVFSESLDMLYILEAALKARGISTVSLVGKMEPPDRDKNIQDFQEGSVDVFLLSKKAGGVGITLTAANRVIVLDPWWNPAVEDQAVDRAYRFGQKREVVVYRLMTCGTIEEIKYRRQVYKKGLFVSGTSNQAVEGYFTEEELHKLPGGLEKCITSSGFHACGTQELLQHLHGGSHAEHLPAPIMEQLLQLPAFMEVTNHTYLFKEGAIAAVKDCIKLDQSDRLRDSVACMRRAAPPVHGEEEDADEEGEGEAGDEEEDRGGVQEPGEDDLPELDEFYSAKSQHLEEVPEQPQLERYYTAKESWSPSVLPAAAGAPASSGGATAQQTSSPVYGIRRSANASRVHAREAGVRRGWLQQQEAAPLGTGDAYTPSDARMPYGNEATAAGAVSDVFAAGTDSMLDLEPGAPRQGPAGESSQQQQQLPQGLPRKQKQQVLLSPYLAPARGRSEENATGGHAGASPICSTGSSRATKGTGGNEGRGTSNRRTAAHGTELLRASSKLPPIDALAALSLPDEDENEARAAPAASNVTTGMLSTGRYAGSAAGRRRQ